MPPRYLGISGDMAGERMISEKLHRKILMIYFFNPREASLFA